MSTKAIILVQFGPTFNVSTLTTLLASLDIRAVRSVLVTLKNPSGTDPVTLIVDPSTSGTAFNTNRRQSDVAQPGEEAHVSIQPESLHAYLRISAQTDSPGFPTVNGVTFEVRAECADSGVYERLLRQTPGATYVW